MPSPDHVLLPVALSDREKRSLAALVSAAIPPGEATDLPVDQADVAEKVGLALAYMGTEGSLGVRAGLWFFEWLSVLRYGRPFSSLDSQRQTDWLTGWAESSLAPFRLAARLLLTMVKPAHVSRRAFLQQISFPGDRHDDVKPEVPSSLPRDRVVLDPLERDRTVRCEVVVIGSGAGGAVMAAELAERGVDVVLIESGRLFTADDFKSDLPKRFRETYLDGGATVALGRPAIPIPLGNTVGGTTTINSGTCFRTPETVLDDWKRMGLDIDRLAIKEATEKVEQRMNVIPTPDHLLGGSSHVIRDGAEALGIQHGPLGRNIRNCKASGVCCWGCPRDAKQSTNLSYVPRALQNGAMLYAGFRANEVLIQNGRAVGVVARQRDSGRTLTVRAKAVVASCGTISAVPFLRGAGIRSTHLGRHLTIHPAGKIGALMTEDVNGWNDTPQGYGVLELAEQGITMEGAYVAPSYGAVAFPFVGREFTKVMEDYKKLAMFGLMVKDDGNGRVYSGPGGRPIITYWLGEHDKQKLVRGFRMLTEIFFAAGAKQVYLPIAGRETQKSLAEAMAVFDGPINSWGLELAGFHPLGTARMSGRADEGVVKPSHESWEIPGLYVADGAVVPTSLGVNPQITIASLATMAAAGLADDIRL